MSILNATTTSGVVLTGDTTGNLTIQSAGNTVCTITATGANAGIQLASWAAPAFSAYQSSAQTLSNSTNTKLQFQTKEFDTASAFDNATNYRFTPLVAGYYQVSGGFQIATAATGGSIAIYKNGSGFKSGAGNPNAATSNQWQVSALVYLNGSTDYVELYGYVSLGQALLANAQYTYFQAAMVRSA